MEADLEHPFFVLGQGWSSVSPELTLLRYKLPCEQLKVGDVCISLTNRKLTPSPSDLVATGTNDLKSEEEKVKVEPKEEEAEESCVSRTTMPPPPTVAAQSESVAKKKVIAEKRKEPSKEVTEENCQKPGIAATDQALENGERAVTRDPSVKDSERGVESEKVERMELAAREGDEDGLDLSKNGRTNADTNAGIRKRNNNTLSLKGDEGQSVEQPPVRKVKSGEVKSDDAGGKNRL